MANSEEKQKKEIKENKVKKHFFKDFKAELKKVIWPTPKQLINSTSAVVVIVLITAAIVFVLDVAFESLNKYGITNLQSLVKDKFANEIVENTENEESNENTEIPSDNEIEVEETNTTDDTLDAQE